MKTLTILIPMHLAGQGEINRRRTEAGYAMAALIVGLAVMAVMMTVAMPVWKQTAKREREAEFFFRAEQYARAIGLFQRKFANASPPTIEALVDGKFLRKKYKDPITNDDFVVVRAGAQAQPGGRGTPAPGAAVGGIIGVTSKSKEESLRIYNGRSHYDEIVVVYTPPPQPAGPGGPGGPAGRGTNPTNPNSPFPGGPGAGPFPAGRGGPFPTGPNAPGGRNPGPGGGAPFPFPTGPGRGR
jgi:type II secretory pathway pseudopilin PulG